MNHVVTIEDINQHSKTSLLHKNKKDLFITGTVENEDKTISKTDNKTTIEPPSNTNTIEHKLKINRKRVVSKLSSTISKTTTQNSHRQNVKFKVVARPRKSAMKKLTDQLKDFNPIKNDSRNVNYFHNCKWNGF